MSKKRRQRYTARKRNSKGMHPTILLLAVFILAAAYIAGEQGKSIPTGSDGQQTAATDIANKQELSPVPDNTENTPEHKPAADQADHTGKPDGELKITYLDVGQADCTILQCEGYNMIIDAGNNADAEDILNALRELGITKLEYVVATHSHEDHIGAMDNVLNEFPAEYIIYPQEEKDTVSYRDFLQAAQENGAEYMEPVVGTEFQLGGATAVVLAPEATEGTDANNCSTALLITFGENKFLFTGDAEEESEEAMLALGISLEADVFQAGHHGSSTSNSEAFLEAVNPVYTIISCGADNTYGHPHSEVVARFAEMDVMVYRTDTMGTITVTSDGASIHIATAGSGK